jgi:hypothetical protein
MSLNPCAVSSFEQKKSHSGVARGRPFCNKRRILCSNGTSKIRRSFESVELGYAILAPARDFRAVAGTVSSVVCVSLTMDTSPPPRPNPRSFRLGIRIPSRPSSTPLQGPQRVKPLPANQDTATAPNTESAAITGILH